MTEFVSQAEWGGSGRGGSPIGRVLEVAVHHTPDQDGRGDWATALEEWQQVEAGHLAQGWSGVGYMWGVSGRYAFEGRGWWRSGAHAGTTQGNYGSIGIAFLLDGRNRLPTPTEWRTAADIILEGIRIGALSPAWSLWGHRDYVATACPGDLVYAALNTLHRYVADPSLGAGAQPAPPPPPAPIIHRRKITLRSSEL